MRKIYLSMLALMAFGMTQMQAQTILEEDFETGNTGSKPTPVAKGEGWTVVNGYTGSNAKYNWHNYYSDPEGSTGPTISGACCAAVDAPVGSSNDGYGPREEILVSPELDLDDTYQLQFSWRVSPMNADNKSKYDLQVRVIEDDNLKSAETIFSIQSEQMLRESGVSTFPITTWDVHTSKVDLSDWKGQKVKVAFVFKMFTDYANVVWLDDISVKKHTPHAGPAAQVNFDRVNFGEMYVGEKFYSDVITLTNVGKDGLKITGVDFPAGITTNLRTEDVNLLAFQSVRFQIAYNASLASPAQGNAVLHTTGGDVTIAFQAKKQFVPEDYQLENFEYWVPAGWKSKGFSCVNTALEGDQSAYCGGDFSVSTLTSPRLDLSQGGNVIFTYFNGYDGDTAPEYDPELQLSTDGGKTWSTKWTFRWVGPEDNDLNVLKTDTVELPNSGNNCYVRWYYPAVESDDEGAFDHSNFYLDRVLLPNVYGSDGAPLAATIIAPANETTGIYPRDIKLQWGPAQFAEGYKLYVGSNSAMNNLVDGKDLGTDMSYNIPAADYQTTYYWKVVPYNEKGDCMSPAVWQFTTQNDATVSEFPYEENFATKNVPEGWLLTPAASYNRTWYVNELKPYNDGKVTYNVLTSSWLNSGENNAVTTPEFQLPADKYMTLTFFWGDGHPADLVADPSGNAKKQNVEPNNGVSDCVLEIFADGVWTNVSHISEKATDDDKKNWIEEKIDLAQYVGKKVMFRWTHYSYSGADDGSSLAHIVVSETKGDYIAFNQTGWDAGKVNYEKAINSGDIFTMINKGTRDQKVKSVSFNTPNFSSSIAVGQEIKTDDAVSFNIQFNALQTAAAVKDTMVIAFESGATAELPVSGEALADNVLYYGFAPNTLDYYWKDDFTMIDKDRQVTYDPNYYLTIFEDAGNRLAFTQVTHNNENLKAHSGTHSIAAISPDNNSAAEDWLISRQMLIKEGASLDFYARNLGTTGSVFIGDNDLHCVTVLVSDGDNTDTSDFQVVMREKEMAYLGDNEWHHFVVDLSAFADKNVYVAVRHTTVSANWMAFFDDFTFSNVSLELSSIDEMNISRDAQVEVYGLNGMKVAEGTAASTIENLKKGFYVVKSRKGDDVKTMRIVRK